MNFTEPLIAQYDKFFVFIGFGFLVGFFYDFVFFVRELISRKKAAWIIQDIFFSIAVTISAYLMFLAYSNGEIRIILIFSSAVGFAVYKLTIGKQVAKVLEKVAGIINYVIDILLRPFKALTNFIERKIGKIKSKFKDIATKRRNHKKKEINEDLQNPKKKKHILKKFNFITKKDLKKEQKSV